MSLIEEYLLQESGVDSIDEWHDVYSEHNEHYDVHTDTDATHP